MHHGNQRLADIISSWTRSSASLQKLHGATKPYGDKSDWAIMAMKVVRQKPVGFSVQPSVLLERLVKAPSKVLTSKSVQTNINKNLGVVPVGETIKVSGATANEHQSTAESLPSNRAEKEAGEKKKAKKADVTVAPSTESSDSEATVIVPPVLITKKHRTKRAKKVPPTTDTQAESQPGPIPDIPARGDKGSTTGGPEATMATPPELEKQAGDGSNTPEHEERMECENQTEKESQEGNASIVAQGEQVDSTADVWKGAGNREVTHFLPKIDPADKGKGALSYLDRPNAVEKHYLLVIQDIRERSECQLRVFDQWHRFITGYRLYKIPSMKFVQEFAKTENRLFSWAEKDKVPEEEDEPQKSSSYGSSGHFIVHNEDSGDSFSSADPSLSLSPNLNLGPSPSEGNHSMRGMMEGLDRTPCHDYLQVYTASWRTSISIGDISRFYDASNIQLYKINSKKFVYLNPNGKKTSPSLS
ncbi:hypothetical protein F511_30097 [Dorcoceras hygrometricum]|uniref:Uncharacterized protein n=1 Tax=Dorcoceras hygrometricum TaxID=472368 RepID=A0A2Z7D3V3_9LAMI|nr:hypothetical protein F511_30097 [Dorcoceras hygrometricum]